MVGKAEEVQHIYLPEPGAELAGDSECLVAVSDGFFRASHLVGVAEAARPSWCEVIQSCHGLRTKK